MTPTPKMFLPLRDARRMRLSNAAARRKSPRPALEPLKVRRVRRAEWRKGRRELVAYQAAAGEVGSHRERTAMWRGSWVQRGVL